MESGTRDTWDFSSEASDEFTLLRERLANLSGQDEFLIAIGSEQDVSEAFGSAPASDWVVQVEVSATRIRLSHASRADASGRSVVWVRPALPFDPAEIERVRREITSYEPQVVVVVGREGSAADDSRWARAIADGWTEPGVLALTSDLAHQLPTFGEPIPSPDASEPRHVNTVVQRIVDRAPITTGVSLDVDTAYVLGIGIGPRRQDSLLGEGSSIPHEVLGRRARRVDVYLEHVDPPGGVRPAPPSVPARRRAGIHLSDRGRAPRLHRLDRVRP
ncbi:hypothetical protein [Streptomyces sp. NPDC046371]|uniref:hypothetical protein n=1 Tax=Streptomyces sp. NPDC046371 TaxID=3154916 RepID=UPI0033E80865